MCPRVAFELLIGEEVAIHPRRFRGESQRSWWRVLGSDRTPPPPSASPLPTKSWGVHRPVPPKPHGPAWVARGSTSRKRRRDQCGHQLGDPLSPPHLERLRAEIGEDDLHFAAIIMIDRARCVQTSNPVLERKARARAHLDLIARRYRDGETGRNRPTITRSQRQFSAATTSSPAAPSVA